MSRGIVKVKPIITAKGKLELDQISSPNTYNLSIGHPLYFQNPEPDFSVNEGSIVECEILSDSLCRVTKLVQR